MSTRLAQTLFSIVLVLALSFAVVSPAFASAPAPDKSTAKFEIEFMQDMIDHHMMAVMMAEMCVEKAVHEELRMVCEQIIATQSQEMMMMQMWLQDWYGITYMPEMDHSGMMHKMMMMEGAEFEIMFMEMMIKHHLGAIKEGEKCLKKAYHPELLSLCHNIIVTQTQEIEQMQTWLCEWYGICKDYLKKA